MIRAVAPEAARAAIHAGGEIAFLDLREAGPFSEGHPLFAVPCPFSRFELSIGPLVPRTDVPLLLMDGGDGIADRAAAAALAMGYSDISVVAGGAPAWAAAGFTLYKGVNVPSKTLGELAELARHPRMIDADELHRWQGEGRDFRFFDCRPAGEYAKMRVPGSTCLPNGELAHRFDAAVPPGTPVVITCAGRTRGIIGSLGLALAGLGEDVYALENGTQGWALAGYPLERGNAPGEMPPLDPVAMDATRRRAADLIEREGLAAVDAAGIAALTEDRGRTTFLIDVRSSGEAAEDPLPAFRHALSGQLVQATDQWIGVRRARIVLADDLGLRAAIAAWWLRALGFTPLIHLIEPVTRALRPRATPAPDLHHASCEAGTALAALRAGKGRLIDLRNSDGFRKGHVAGSIWSIRPQLSGLSGLAGREVFVIGDSDAEAALGAQELDAAGLVARVVTGGIDALRAAGAALEPSADRPARWESPDVTWFADGRHDGDLDASRLYLAWEQGLVDQLDAQDRAEFRF